MSKKLDRLNRVIEIVKEKNGATVKELAQLFDVSEMTIRRDLAILEEQNIVNNVYGAVIFNPAGNKDLTTKKYSLTAAKTTREKEKICIGKYAATLIQPNDVVIIDTGSTTEQLASHLSGTTPMTILCYNINILNSLIEHDNIKLIVGGGYFHPNTLMFESNEGLTLIRSIRATKVFVSAAGIHEKLGVTCSNNYEVATKHAIMHSAVERILLADSSKFGVVRTSYFGDLTDFHTIITDTGLSPEWAKAIEELGIRLILV